MFANRLPRIGDRIAPLSGGPYHRAEPGALLTVGAVDRTRGVVFAKESPRAARGWQFDPRVLGKLRTRPWIRLDEPFVCGITLADYEDLVAAGTAQRAALRELDEQWAHRAAEITAAFFERAAAIQARAHGSGP